MQKAEMLPTQVNSGCFTALALYALEINCTAINEILVRKLA